MITESFARKLKTNNYKSDLIKSFQVHLEKINDHELVVYGCESDVNDVKCFIGLELSRKNSPKFKSSIQPTLPEFESKPLTEGKEKLESSNQDFTSNDSEKLKHSSVEMYFIPKKQLSIPQSSKQNEIRKEKDFLSQNLEKENLTLKSENRTKSNDNYNSCTNPSVFCSEQALKNLDISSLNAYHEILNSASQDGKIIPNSNSSIQNKIIEKQEKKSNQNLKDSSIDKKYSSENNNKSSSTKISSASSNLKSIFIDGSNIAFRYLFTNL